MSKCTDIVLVEKLNNVDMLRVTIDNTIEAYWLFNYSDALNYIDKEVIVDYRQDIYNGELCRFIKTFTIPTVIQTLDKSTDIKLYCDQVDNHSNVSFSDIEVGESYKGAIVYCTACSYKASKAAVWQELIIRDKSMHTAVLRIFDYESKEVNFAGKYVMAELRRNKYGFQSEFINEVPGETIPNPEITIAKEYIQNFFIDDDVAQSYISKYNVLQFLEEAMDYETGYGLMRLAMELAMIDKMDNISRDVDFKSISQALLAKRGYLVRESVLSKTVNNVLLATSIQWPNKALVMRLLDECSENKPAEYYVMESIQSTVNTLLEVRKGTPLDVV